MLCGIDIGGTKIGLAVYGDDLELSASWRVPTPGHDYESFLEALAGLVAKGDRFCTEIHSIGVALPGIADDHGRRTSAHVPCINGKHLVHDIERRLARPVAHTNDMRAFAVSEAHGGAIEGVSVALAMILGTGVGGTLCIDGRPVAGANNIAGEYGHLPIAPNVLEKHGLPAQQCACGATGCAETVLSGPGLLRTAALLGSAHSSVPEWLDHLRRCDGTARRIFEIYIDCLGYFVSRLTLMLDPDVVVFGGGLSAITEIYGAVPAAAEAHMFEGVQAPPIRPPAFGPSSGARGAAILALEAAAGG